MRARTCHYCKRSLIDPKLDTSRGRAKLSATRDHVIPRCRGGRRTVPCCRQCNHLKGSMCLETWEHVMRSFPRWWREFKNQGELLNALAWQRLRPKPRFPKGLVCFPPLCRGLPISVGRAG